MELKIEFTEKGLEGIVGEDHGPNQHFITASILPTFIRNIELIPGTFRYPVKDQRVLKC